MPVKDLLDEIGGGEAGLEGEGEDLAAGGLDFFAAGDEVGPVGALDEEIGEDGGDEFAGGVFVEEGDGIDGIEREGDAGAGLFITDGAGGAFEALDARIGVEGEDENVAESASGLEEADVAGVEDVVAAVGENNTLAFGLPQRPLRDEIRPGIKFGHGYTFSL